MFKHEYDLKTRCQSILEENGGAIADKSCRILLEDSSLKNLHLPLEWISKNWRDPLTPAMISLSCEAVGGTPEDTCDAALAMSLMQLSFFLWDDIVDKAPIKQFKPTIVGKFGEGTALIIGGVASAKAFSILNLMKVDNAKRQAITELVWNFWAKMAQAETVNLKLRTRRDSSSSKKLWVLETEGEADLGTCMRIGAVLGNGSAVELESLADFGMRLCVILDLWKGFLLSVNLTLDLAEKIRNRALPYSLLWARERSEKLRKKLEDLVNANVVKPSDIAEIVELALETGAMEKTMKIIRKFSRKAEEDIGKIKKNKGSQTLQALVSLVKEQPELFAEKFLMA